MSPGERLSSGRLGRATTARAVAVALFAAACGSEPEVGGVRRPPAQAVEEALLGTEASCTQGAECATGVCAEARCISLADGGYVWKAHTIANALRGPLATAQGLDAAQSLLEKLRDSEGLGLQEGVAGFIGASGVEALAPLLEPLLASESKRVALQAQLAVLRLGRRLEEARLEALLTHDNAVVRLATVDSLSGALRRESQQASRATGATLATVNDLSSWLLDAALGDADHRVVQRALVGLTAAPRPEPNVIDELREIGLNATEGFLAHDVARLLRAWGESP